MKTENILEFIIVGAGPAGLQMGYYLHKSNRSYTILEKGAKAGSFFAQYPRHRRLISINKVYTGHDDPEKSSKQKTGPTPGNTYSSRELEPDRSMSEKNSLP